MKLFGKMTLMAFAMMITASFGFLSPMLVGGAVHGVTPVYAPVIQLTGYTPTYKVGEDRSFTPQAGGDEMLGYALPKATVQSTDGTYTVTAKDPSFRDASTVLGTDGIYYLVTSKTGVFQITYTAQETDSSVTKKTATRDISVEIVGNGAKLVMPENVEQIIPTVAYKGNEITFPRAEVWVDDEIDEDASKAVQISLTDALGNVKASFNQTTTGYMTYTVADGDSGDFIVKYSYTNGSNVISKSETFRVNTNTQEIALKYADSLTTKLESLALEVGVEATLPKPTVVNSKANDADVSSKTYTVITVKCPDGTTETITDYKFTPKKEGSYRISYKTTDFFGNTCEVSLQRDKIKLSANSISVKVVEPYVAANIADIDFDERKTAEHDIDSILYIEGASTSVIGEFPAILAQGGWKGYSNLQLIRTIWKNGNRIATLETSHTVDGSSVTNLPSELGRYEFTSEGTYEIYYQAKYLDDQGNEVTSTQKSLSYTFEVKKVAARPTETEAGLEIKAPSISSTAVLKDSAKTITFNAPTVSDNFDNRLKVEVTYKFDGYATTFDAVKNSDGTYSVEIVKPADCSDAEWTATTEVAITFKATDFLDYSDKVTKTIELLDFSSDVNAPALDNRSIEATYDNTTKEITLPTVSFTDNVTNATNLSLVMYVMKDGKLVTTFNGTPDNTTHSVSLSTFAYEPAQEGDYTFVYVATDQNYNMTTYTLDCTVDFELGYSVSIDSISTKEYGDAISLPSLITVTKNGQVINFSNDKVKVMSTVTEADVTAMDNGTLLIQVQGAYRVDNTGINGDIVCLEGDIILKAWAKDDGGICDFVNNSSSTVKFSSADTKKPEFTIEGESEGRSVIASYEFGDTSASNTHEIPWFNEIKDNSDINAASMKIELTYSNSTTPFKTFTIDDLATANGLEYTVTKEGKIQAVYSVADVKGNKTTREFWIYVGDVLAPEISLANDAITSPGKVGGTFTVDLSKISIINDTNLSKTNDLKIVVKCNGNVIETSVDDDDDNVLTFTASEAGTYVLTFDITDDAGNEATTVTKTITIKNETSTVVNSSTVWGTIMIIVSLIIVGLVIFFFVKPSKSKTKPTDKKTK